MGTGTHLASEILNMLAGTSTTHVPPAAGDDVAATIAKVVRGHTDYAVLPISIAAPYICNGNLFALGVTASRRSPLLPDVPTIEEAGVAGYECPIWYGLWAPADTPTTIADKIATDVAAVFTDPDLRDWLVEHGAEPLAMTRAEFAVLCVTRVSARRRSSATAASRPSSAGYFLPPSKPPRISPIGLLWPPPPPSTLPRMLPSGLFPPPPPATRAGLRRVTEGIVRVAMAEGFRGHAQSVLTRFEAS